MSEQPAVLIVDDSPTTLDLMSAMLRAEGLAVRTADSGQLALAAIAAHPPALVLLDIRMPGIDGFEVCRRLKADPKTRNIPVIFISAANEVEERVEGFRLGAVDYIAKPVQREECLARIKAHLEIGHAFLKVERG